MNLTTGKKIFISWAPYSRRSRSLSTDLNLEACFIHYLKFQRPAYSPFKYILQAVHTLVLVLRKRPSIVFVQDPPIFATFFVYLYTLLTFGQARFVVDAHSGALTHPWWKPFRGLQKFLYRRAVTVITTNNELAKLVKSWGADSMALAGPPVKLCSGEVIQLDGVFNMMLVNTFSIDEPLPVALDAVATIPDLHLYVTGDKSKAPQALLKSAPPNVTFTDFLPDNGYINLMSSVDAVMVLTSEDFTLQLGAMEAVSLGKPVLTSDLTFLREHFNRGTIHVPNTSEGVRQGIMELRQNLPRLSREILDLQRAHQEEWLVKSRRLHELVANGGVQ